MGGADKGLVPWQGEPLIAHVLRRVQPQVARLLISANRNVETYRVWAPVIADPDPARFEGSLTGIHTALLAMTTDWLAVAPCDLPGLPLDAFARLAADLGGATSAYAAPTGQSHSLVCLLHRSLAAPLGRFLIADAQAFCNFNAAADLRPASRA